MSIATQKKICWVILLMSVGWLSVTAAATIINFPQAKLSNPWFVKTLFWEALSLIALIISFDRLKRCYRLEPATALGHWHISLLEIYVATFFSAFCMILWLQIWPMEFLYWGASLSIVAGVWLVCSMLVAERRGFKRLKTKIPMSLGLTLKGYGLVAIAFFASVGVIVTFSDGPLEAARILFALSRLNYFIGESDIIGDVWLGVSVRLGLVSFIIGSAMTRLLRDKR